MSVTFTGLSGEGHLALDSSFSVAVQFIDVLVTTAPPRARQIGSGSIPKAIWNVGQFGLGWFTDDPSGNPTDQLAFPTFIHEVQETLVIPNAQAGAVFYGSFWWRLSVGTVIDAVISW